LLDTAALRARGHVRLPQTLEEALDRLRASTVVSGWFPDGFADVYVMHKKGERAYLGERSQSEICALYEQVY
jgi:glutamine synthetase